MTSMVLPRDAVGAVRAGQQSSTGVGTTILLCLLAVLYPLQTEAIGGVNLSAGDVLVGPVVLFLAWRFVRGPVPLPRYVPHVLTLFVVIVASVVVNALTWTTYYQLNTGVMEAVKFLAVAAWMLAVFALFLPQLGRRFTIFAVASATVAALWSLHSVFENVVLGVQRPTGPFENPNMYGNYLVFNAFLTLGAVKVMAEDRTGLALGGLVWLRKHRSLLTIILLPMIVLGLMSTGSRGSMLSFAAGVLAGARLWIPKRITFRMVATAALGLSLLGAGMSWFLSQHPYMLKRIERTGAGEHNVDERLRLWRAARAAFMERPVLGIGYGEFPRYGDYRHGLPRKVAHEMYLSVAAELGAVGFVAFVWLLLSALWDGWRIRTPVRGAVACCGFACLVAACIQGLFANIEQFRTLWILFGCIAAAVAVSEPSGVGRLVRRAGGSWVGSRLAFGPRVRRLVPR
jgi:O-antigen ligase